MNTSVDCSLTALSAEARRRGLSYGQLVVALSRLEQEEVIAHYIQQQEEAEIERQKLLAEVKKQKAAKKSG